MNTNRPPHDARAHDRESWRKPEATWRPRRSLGILLLRLCVGGMMLAHGCPKLLMLAKGQGGAWADPLGIGPACSLALCVMAEFFCSMAIMLGFMTRLAALALVANFAVAVFVANRNQPWDKIELGALYLACFAALLLTGAGRYSIDHALLRHFRRKRLAA